MQKIIPIVSEAQVVRIHGKCPFAIVVDHVVAQNAGVALPALGEQGSKLILSDASVNNAVQLLHQEKIGGWKGSGVEQVKCGIWASSALGKSQQQSVHGTHPWV
jgi:hypothetical protein